MDFSTYRSISYIRSICVLCIVVTFCMKNSVDPDQTPRSAASDLCLHYLPISLYGKSVFKCVNDPFGTISGVGLESGLLELYVAEANLKCSIQLISHQRVRSVPNTTMFGGSPLKKSLIWGLNGVVCELSVGKFVIKRLNLIPNMITLGLWPLMDIRSNYWTKCQWYDFK